MIVKEFLSSIRKGYRSFFRNRMIEKKKKLLTNKDVTVISSNCYGAVMAHDMGMQFKSPFVNIWMYPSDYLKIISNIKEYMQYDLDFIKEDGIAYPVGMLNDAKIYFMHYKTEEEARDKWNERVKRINYNNMCFIFTDRDGCTEEQLKEYDSLPYKSKVVFVNKPHSDIKSSFYIKGFEKKNSVGNCLDYKNQITYKKYYDDFDYVAWLNNAGE